jgi:hypothetical protein
MVLIRGHNPTEVRHESKRCPKIARKTLRSFVRIEWPSLARQVDLRRLEAAEDDSTLVGQHAVGPVEAQPVGVSQD